MKGKKALIAGLIVLGFVLCSCRKEEKIKLDSFPISIENNKILIHDLITYDGPNPDNDNLIGESIAAIRLENVSNTMIESLSLSLFIEDKEYQFVIEYLPAESSVIALDINNQNYDGKTKCDSFSYKCSFTELESLDSLKLDIDLNKINITNIVNDTLYNLDIVYRCYGKEFYFGGKAYHITIPELLYGQSMIYNDEYCFLGDIDIIGIVTQK